MHRHPYLGSLRLGGTSMLLTALCSLGLAVQMAAAQEEESAKLAGHAAAQKQKNHLEARPSGAARPAAATPKTAGEPTVAPTKIQSEKKLVAAHGTPLEKLPDDSAEAGMLREAYARLEVADHDYDGHRRRAMGQVSDAAKALGVNLKGDGKGHELQGASDEHLHAAQGLLEGLVSGVKGPGLNHVKSAIGQISEALAVH
jgi:hypothetical protein